MRRKKKERKKEEQYSEYSGEHEPLAICYKVWFTLGGEFIPIARPVNAVSVLLAPQSMLGSDLGILQMSEGRENKDITCDGGNI